VGQYRSVGMGILARCGSAKKRNPQKFSMRSQRLGLWRRLVVIFSGVNVDGVWNRSGGIKVDFGQWVRWLQKRVPEHDLWDAKKKITFSYGLGSLWGLHVCVGLLKGSSPHK
jgi:hypothetical protein